MNIFETIEQDIIGFFHKIPQEAQDVLTVSNKFLNTVKVLSTSATGQTVIDLAEAFFPAATGIVSGAEAILSKLIGFTAETPGQLLLQATQKAATLSGVAKVAAYTNIAVAVAQTANDVKGGTLTPQQIISAVQLVHSPGVMSGTDAATVQGEPPVGTALSDGNVELPA